MLTGEARKKAKKVAKLLRLRRRFVTDIAQQKTLRRFSWLCENGRRGSGSESGRARRRDRREAMKNRDGWNRRGLFCQRNSATAEKGQILRPFRDLGRRPKTLCRSVLAKEANLPEGLWRKVPTRCKSLAP